MSQIYHIKVVLPNTKYFFDVEFKKDNDNVMWASIEQNQHNKQACVLISFDPIANHLERDNDVATIHALYFNTQCGTIQPIEPKKGTRAMLLGALHTLKYIAQTKKKWPHLKVFHLSDESTYKCSPKFKNEIHTFATDLLTGDQTYYE